MCEPKATPVAELVDGALNAMSWVARGVVRVGWLHASDEEVEGDRLRLAWRWPFWLLAAAATAYWLGRWAAVVFAGVAVLSWAVARLLGAELARRRDEPDVEDEVESERPRLRAVS